MAVYYNEIDRFAAAWLRELIKAGLIADGEVDERDIRDVRPGDLTGFSQCHFFAGIGGWSYALRLAGWPDDRFIWTGSCPCQPFSAAGTRKGGGDDRHLWPHWARLIREYRPVTIFGEQVESAIAHGWIDAVFDDLEREGYACGAASLPAASVGAPHIRHRLWFVAVGNANNGQWRLKRDTRIQSTHRLESDRSVLWDDHRTIDCRDGKTRIIEPSIEPLAHGLPARVGRLRGYGNAIVPQVAHAFIEAYLDCER